MAAKLIHLQPFVQLQHDKGVLARHNHFKSWGGHAAGVLSVATSGGGPCAARATWPIDQPHVTEMPVRTLRSAVARVCRRAYTGLTARDPYDVVALALLTALILLVVTTYHSYAISNDEEVQQRYGEMIVAYYTSGLSDNSLFHYLNLYLYGGLFDVVAVLIQHALPIADIYTVRHLLCAFIGIGGVAAAWATARMMAGSRAGAIAAFALAACGPWYGAMFNHTKDIPFAAAMMAAVYFLLRIARSLPQPRRFDVLAFGLLLGAALGIRVLALLLIGYAGLAILLTMPKSNRSPLRDGAAFIALSALALTPALLIGYALMALAWPWSVQSPLNPLHGLIDFGGFHYEIRTLLAGRIYEMADVPRWYVPAYLLFKLPLAMIAGALLAGIVCLARSASERRSEIRLLAFIAIFPVLCEVIYHGPAFTGLRHFLFVVPALAVLAGIGFDWLIGQCARWRLWHARTATAGIAAVLMWNAAQLVRLHPYEYLYYNALVGGLAGAAGSYETDYWVNIMPEAVVDLETFVADLDRRTGRVSHRYTVAVCGERLPFLKTANARLQWTADWKKAEFFIAPTHMNCDRALDGKVITTISRLGARIGVVKDRRTLVPSEFAGRH